MPYRPSKQEEKRLAAEDAKLNYKIKQQVKAWFGGITGLYAAKETSYPGEVPKVYDLSKMYKILSDSLYQSDGMYPPYYDLLEGSDFFIPVAGIERLRPLPKPASSSEVSRILYGVLAPYASLPEPEADPIRFKYLNKLGEKNAAVNFGNLTSIKPKLSKPKLSKPKLSKPKRASKFTSKFKNLPKPKAR